MAKYTENELFNFIGGSDITGESTYDIWRSLGHEEGTAQEFLEYLRDGDDCDCVVDESLNTTSTNAVQNKVLTEKFNEILDQVNNLPNLHLWKRYSSVASTYKETQVSDVSVNYLTLAMFNSASAYYADSVSVVNGAFVNDNFVLTESVSVSALQELIKGKFVRSGIEENMYKYYRLPEDVVLTGVYDNGDLISVKADKAYLLELDTSSMSFVDFAVSQNKDTYPASGMYTDGYWYEYFKQLGEDNVGEEINMDELLPEVTEEDNGKFLMVENGKWSVGGFADGNEVLY